MPVSIPPKKNTFLRAEHRIFGLVVEYVSDIPLFEDAKNEPILERTQAAGKSRVAATAIRCAV